jgi:osmotically inducible protein OsmC
MQRKAAAVWKNGLKSGNGMISTDSKVLTHAAYSFGTRFENIAGTNPEELVAAAHAACFSMALSAELEKKGIHSNSVNTNATAVLEKLSEGWRVTEMRLEVMADIPNISAEAFENATNEAKDNCPISRLLNTKITMNAKLKQKAA